jgi:hypothetical protein
MSRKIQAKRSIRVADSRLSRARSTRAQRKASGYPINAIVQACAEMVRTYLAVAKVDEVGCSVATLHNKLAAIRKSMSSLGMNPAEKRLPPSPPDECPVSPSVDRVFLCLDFRGRLNYCTFKQ